MTTYNIACRGRQGEPKVVYRPISGYIYNVSGIRIGVSNRNVNGGKLCMWTATELTSGYSVFSEPTRDAVLQRVNDMPDTMYDRVFDVVAATEAAGKDANPGLKPRNVYRPRVTWTIHTAEQEATT